MKIDTKSFSIGFAVGTVATALFCIGVLLVAAWIINHRSQIARTSPAPTFCPVAGDAVVTQVLMPIRQKYNVPAMAMAVVTSDGLKYAGVAGVRKRGTEIPVSLDDLWHLGSDGKAMTSTLIARLVERGQLNWDLTMEDAFPDMASTMHADFRKATLIEVLSHRAGLPANLDLAEYLGEDAQSLRLRAVREELAKKPQSAPGSDFLYSNLGYIIAAAVVEKVTGQAWERVITEEIFKPLHMTTAGFGGTGTPGQIDQPWPHKGDGLPFSTNGPTVDNPPVMGPAGRIHCSIQDWARFIQDQLRGARDESALLRTGSYQKLHAPPSGGDYALGWQVAQRGWAGGKALNHGGDNTLNFANVWVAPQKDFAVLVCVNQSGNSAFKASDEAMTAAIVVLTKNTPAP